MTQSSSSVHFPFWFLWDFNSCPSSIPPTTVPTNYHGNFDDSPCVPNVLFKAPSKASVASMAEQIIASIKAQDSHGNWELGSRLKNPHNL